MSQEEKSQREENESKNENIFTEFESEQTIDDTRENSIKKGFYDYLSLFNSIIVGINIVFLIGVIIAYTYITIQTQQEKKTYSFLAPICNIFLGSAIDFIDTGCYNLYGLYKEVLQDINTMKQSQTLAITPMLGELFGIENFNYSQKVLFLLDRSAKRMKPLIMLQDFDAMKNKYSPIDKAEVQCYEIEFYDTTKMKISCEAYSSDWDTAIAGLREGVLFYDFEGTSITRATAFMDYIDNAVGSNFSLVSKTENLNYRSIQKGPYTQKTPFQMDLEYIPSALAF